MIHFVLDDLGSEALEGLQPHLQLLRLVAHLDLAKSLGLPGAAQKRQTALLCFVWN